MISKALAALGGPELEELFSKGETLLLCHRSWEVEGLLLELSSGSIFLVMVVTTMQVLRLAGGLQQALKKF